MIFMSNKKWVFAVRQRRQEIAEDDGRLIMGQVLGGKVHVGALGEIQARDVLPSARASMASAS